MFIYNSKIPNFLIDERGLLFGAKSLLAAQVAAIAVAYTV